MTSSAATTSSKDLDWVVIAQDHASILLAPVTRQRQRAILLVALGALLAVGASWLCSFRRSERSPANADRGRSRDETADPRRARR